MAANNGSYTLSKNDLTNLFKATSSVIGSPSYLSDESVHKWHLKFTCNFNEISVYEFLDSHQNLSVLSNLTIVILNKIDNFYFEF